MSPRNRPQSAPSTTDPTELLLYCLTFDRDEPAIGAVTAVQQELKLLASLMLAEPPMETFDAMPALSATLEMMARRLEVACELMRRPPAAGGTSRKRRGPDGPPAAGGGTR